jgi:hypothetical protein
MPLVYAVTILSSNERQRPYASCLGVFGTWEDAANFVVESIIEEYIGYTEDIDDDYNVITKCILSDHIKMAELFRSKRCYTESFEHDSKKYTVDMNFRSISISTETNDFNISVEVSSHTFSKTDVDTSVDTSVSTEISSK